MKGRSDRGADLSVEVAGIRLSNPLLLASGIADETGLSMAEAVKRGAGGVVTKSLSLKPREGHPNPCVVEMHYGLINAMGLPNPGIREYAEEIRVFREATKGRAPVIASVFGGTVEEYAEASRIASMTGVDGIELNGSCPNAKGLGLQFGQDPDVITDLVKAVKAKVGIPVFFKLTPQTQDIVALAEAAQGGGADGLVAINTIPAMSIDVWSGRPILTNRTGGLSGPAIRPVGVRCVFEMCQSGRISIPVVGVGGIGSWEDALEYVMAGASAVQIGTAVAWGDLDVFGTIRDGLARFLERTGARRLSDLRGRALEGRS